MKILEIDQIRTTVLEALKKLTPGKADDLDTVAYERVALKEKLALLNEAETTECERLEAEEAKTRAKKRHALLLDVAKRADAAEGEYNSLTERATELTQALVKVLAEREQTFSQQTRDSQPPNYSSLLLQKIALSWSIAWIAPPARYTLEVSPTLGAMLFTRLAKMISMWPNDCVNWLRHPGTPPKILRCLKPSPS